MKANHHMDDLRMDFGVGCGSGRNGVWHQQWRPSPAIPQGLFHCFFIPVDGDVTIRKVKGLQPQLSTEMTTFSDQRRSSATISIFFHGSSRVWEIILV